MVTIENCGTVGERVFACRTERGMTQVELARLSRLTQPTISGLESGESNTSGSLASIAAALGVSALWLETGLGERNISDDATASFGSGTELVPLVEARGSCGNSRVGFVIPDYAPIALCASTLSRLHIQTKNKKLVALYADGDSMLNYITHGDILFFDTNDCELRDGGIYLIDTPDGLRVKRVSRRADGRFILRSDNMDKTRFPDEDYSAEQTTQLSVKGKFAMRMGG
jgi:phage repressor protein C with HTH and peptisase S24 domain